MSSGVAWIDRKVGELRGAREHLTRIGLMPRPAGGDRHGDRVNQRPSYTISEGWRLPHWTGVFTDDQLIEMAKERGFRP